MIKQDKNHSLAAWLMIWVLLNALLVDCSVSPILENPPTKTEWPTRVISTATPQAHAATATATSTPVPTLTLAPTNTIRPPTSTMKPCPPFTLDTQRPDPDIPENYIGRHYDSLNLPTGLLAIKGFLIDLDGNREFALSTIQDEGRIMWWLEKLVCLDQGTAYFEIVDAIASPPLREGETVADACFKGDKSDIFTNAVGIFDKNSSVVVMDGYIGNVYEQITFAFYLDPGTKKFISISTEGVICLADIGP